jgi:hypothetical protein
MYLLDRCEYILTLDQPAREQMEFHTDRPISKLKARAKMDMLFDYRGQVINFTVEVSSIKDDLIFCDIPDLLYKDLDRSFSRVDTPSDFQIQFAFLGDRYNLSFPKVMEFETDGTSEFFKEFDPQNLTGLIDQMSGWIKNYASGYKMIIFKERKPDSVEERIVSETGKALFIPSTLGYLPQTDPNPKKRIITEEIFKRYLESTGTGQSHLDDTCARFIKSKYEDGIFSDAWIPILFHEYVLGYIHIWINREGKIPFDFAVLDTIFEFAKVLSYSLKMNGYFENGRLPRESFEGRVIDISASGLLFACPYSNLSSTLLVDSELKIKIIAPGRSINAVARIVRRFRDRTTGYFGCRFIDMAPEDMRFLFESIYGKSFAEIGADFLSG